MTDSNLAIKKEPKDEDDQSAGCSEIFIQHLHGTQSTDSNQSIQIKQEKDETIIESNKDKDTSESRQFLHVSAHIKQEMGDIIIEINNYQETSDSKQSAQARDSKAAERNRLYRLRHREEINRRRREMRNRKKNPHLTLSNIENVDEAGQLTSTSKTSNSHKQRQQRYYERNREEINKRKRDNRLWRNISQPQAESDLTKRGQRRKSLKRRKNKLLQPEVAEDDANNMEDVGMMETAENNLLWSNETIQKIAHNTDTSLQEYNVHFGETHDNRFQDIQAMAGQDYNEYTTIHCKPEMRVDIDVEEYNTHGNPLPGNVLPDIAKVKREVDDDVPEQNVESWDWPKTVKSEIDEANSGNEAPTEVDMSLMNICKVEFDKSISETDKSVSTNVEANNQSDQFYLEISTNVYDASKEEQIGNCNAERELVPKEILTCKICCKVSEGGLCKRCVVDSVPCDSLDNTVVTVDNPEKSAAHTNTYVDIDLEQQKDTGEMSHQCDNETLNENITCNICDYRCISKSELIQHLLKHTEEKLNKCVLCDYICEDSGYLKEHMEYKHANEKYYACKMCEYTTIRRCDLNLHLRKHTGERPFKCDLCDYASSRCSQLNIHIRSKHTKEKNYSCHLCDYKSVTKSHLNQHLRIHTGEKPYKCDLCDYSFTFRTPLKLHIRAVHANERNYSCNMCGNTFFSKAQLIHHVRKHTGEKPFKCDLCDYTCSRSSRLKVHTRTKHTREKKYSCNMCEFKFVTTKGLNQHMRKHSG